MRTAGLDVSLRFIGEKMEDSRADVEIVGHSLGGGMASATSRASGLPATTFNSAGLSPNTVAQYGDQINVDPIAKMI
jgi:putative lipase involved disintegration of autophagic bodies